MEAHCCISGLKSGNQASRVTIWDSAKLGRLNSAEKEDMRKIIDGIGRLSAISQRLRVPITDYERVYLGSQRLYLLTSNGSTRDTILLKGLLKVGRKNLFIRKECGALVEINPLCVLDFYVHVSCQRIGLGRQLFDAMLTNEKKLPHQIGYDRPSQKLLSFLAKHYNLKRFYPQANQFVIFNAYFDSSCEDKMQVQSRLCNCIKGNTKSCTVAFLDSPRPNKEVLHGRRANKSPESQRPVKDNIDDEKIKEIPTTPSIPMRHRSILQDDEVKAVPSMSQIFPREHFSLGMDMDSHYDWMTGTTVPFLKSRGTSRREEDSANKDVSEGTNYLSSMELVASPSKSAVNGSSGKDGGTFYDSNKERFEPSRSMSLGCDRRVLAFKRGEVPKSPKSNHRAQFSGFGAAAALGFKKV